MKRILVAMVFAGFAAPAFAMDDMSCKDYSAMSADEQMSTVGMMSQDSMAAEGSMASTDAMSDEDMTKAVTAACADHPDMMLGDAMQGAMGHM